MYITVDALDECADQSQLIDELLKLQSCTGVRLLFTSRFIADITQRFRSNVTLEVRASEEDVRLFLEGQMPRLPKCIQRDKELQRLIENKIIEAVRFM